MIRLGDVQQAAPQAQADHVPGHRRPRADRDGRRQRRRRRVHLRAGRAELRLHPAVDAAAADPGADRQPGDGGQARRGHRRRACPAHQRAVRPVLGLVQRRRPVHSQLPDHRHRVHRRLARPALFPRQPVHLGARHRGRPDRDHHERQLPPLGAGDVRVHRGERDPGPARVPVAPLLRSDRLPLLRARRPGRGDVDRGAAHHRHRGHHRRAVAALLPAVQRHRQADHAAVHPVRARRHHAGRVRRGDLGLR